MEQIKNYLLTLEEGLRHKVMVRMVEKHLGMVSTLNDGGCTTKMPVGGGSTPNGDWECIDAVWVWIPDIGR